MIKSKQRPGRGLTRRDMFALSLCMLLLFLQMIALPMVAAAQQQVDAESEVPPLDDGASDGVRHAQQHDATEESSSAAEFPSDECSLYLGQSSIPNAGLGIYTARPLKKGEEVGTPELLVPVPDYNPALHGMWMIEDVQWNSGLHEDFRYESRGKTTGVFYPGFGAAVNCHLGLTNVAHTVPSVDRAGLSRARDPGTGAFSIYHDMGSYMTRDLEAGSELFVDYGEGWFIERIPWLGVVPLDKDYKTADRIMNASRDKMDQLEASGPRSEGGSGSPMVMTTDMEDRMWELIRGSTEEGVRAALPAKREELDKALGVGSARYSLPNFIRSREWLEENALCVDNLYPDKSTLPQAGRGAFATRFLRKGSVITPAPVLQLKREAMNMYESKINAKTGEVTYNPNVTVGTQLLLNYCLGHRNSSVLLLPYAPIAGFINHNSTRANAKLRWSKPPLNKERWLSLPPEKLFEKFFGLMMEIVALKDIWPGEEIFLDYGPEWEEAWAKHVAEWVPPDRASSYVSAAEMRNRCIDVRTQLEQLVKPYPYNLQTACYYRVFPPTKADDQPDEGTEGVEMVETEWRGHNNGCLRPCEVLSKTTVDGAEYFTAEMMNGPDMEELCIIRRSERHIISNIPQNMLSFLDKPYSRDQYLPNAFRHEIGVPDELFPTAWMTNETAQAEQ